MGSQFRGVKASSEALGFPQELQKQAANYCYNFKFFQTGFPEDKSKEGWMKFLNDYCALQEVAQLGVPLLFVGDAGDGIKGRAFEPDNKVYGKCGPWAIHALKQVFSDNGWTGFSFGPFLEEAKAKGATVLHKSKKGEIVPESKQLISWQYWRDKVSFN